MAFYIKCCAAVAACCLLAGLLGCASTNNTSDTPWNVPQPWEGAPSIPGSP